MAYVYTNLIIITTIIYFILFYFSEKFGNIYGKHLIHYIAFQMYSFYLHTHFSKMRKFFPCLGLENDPPLHLRNLQIRL